MAPILTEPTPRTPIERSMIVALADVRARSGADTGRVREWHRARIEAGELPDIDPAVRRAIVFGPCRLWAGRWPAGDRTVTMAQARRLLGAAAHAGLRALMLP
jgi:hypothetical protein